MLSLNAHHKTTVLLSPACLPSLLFRTFLCSEKFSNNFVYEKILSSRISCDYPYILDVRVWM